MGWLPCRSKVVWSLVWLLFPLLQLLYSFCSRPPFQWLSLLLQMFGLELSQSVLPPLLLLLLQCWL